MSRLAIRASGCRISRAGGSSSTGSFFPMTWAWPPRRRRATSCRARTRPSKRAATWCSGATISRPPMISYRDGDRMRNRIWRAAPRRWKVSNAPLPSMRPFAPKPMCQFLCRVRDKRPQLLDALVGQPRRRSGERDRPECFGVLVVDRRADASSTDRVLLVVERPAPLPDDAHTRPHRFGRGDRVAGDARQAADLEDRIDLVVGEGGEDGLAYTRRVQRRAATQF